MGDGKIFVRACPVCGKMVQTADQTGQTPCSDACVSKLDEERNTADAKIIAAQKSPTQVKELAGEALPVSAPTKVEAPAKK